MEAGKKVGGRGGGGNENLILTCATKLTLFFQSLYSYFVEENSSQKQPPIKGIDILKVFVYLQDINRCLNFAQVVMLTDASEKWLVTTIKAVFFSTNRLTKLVQSHSLLLLPCAPFLPLRC